VSDASLSIFSVQERPAVATGSISFEGINYVAGPMTDAVISSSQAVEVRRRA
jgi:hypothetical protein